MTAAAVNCLATEPLKDAVGGDGDVAFEVGHTVAGFECDDSVLGDADRATGGVGVEGGEDSVDFGLLVGRLGGD
jgi:hypothetical protein